MAQIRARAQSGFDLFAPPANTDIRNYVWTSALLVSLLVIGVPLAAFLTPVSVWNLILVAGAVYLGVLLATRTEFVGLESALVVLMTFDMGRSLYTYAPGYVALDLRPVDIVAVVLLGVFAYRHRRSWRSIAVGWRMLAVVAYGLFVCWTFLAAVFGAGPSTTAGIIFAAEQLRYLAVLVVVALIVRFSNPWAVIYPLVIAVCGQIAVAIAQIAHGGVFGLAPLGETWLTAHFDKITLGPASVWTGFYAGGFLSFSRPLAIVLLMFIPVVVAVVTRRYWYALPATVAIAGALLVIRVADTDAGVASLFVVVGLLVLLYLTVLAMERNSAALWGLVTTGTVAMVAGGAFLLWEVVTAVQEDGQGTVPFFSTRSLAPRLDQYTAALKIARTHPLFGLGGQNYFIVIPEYVSSTLPIHSLFFSHLAATGFVGLGLYIVSIGALLIVALRKTLDSTATNRFLWASLVCAMIGFHAYAAWDLTASWETATMVFWALAGVVVGAKTDRWEWATASA